MLTGKSENCPSEHTRLWRWLLNEGEVAVLPVGCNSAFVATGASSCAHVQRPMSMVIANAFAKTINLLHIWGIQQQTTIKCSILSRITVLYSHWATEVQPPFPCPRPKGRSEQLEHKSHSEKLAGMTTTTSQGGLHLLAATPV